MYTKEQNEYFCKGIKYVTEIVDTEYDLQKDELSEKELMIVRQAFTKLIGLIEDELIQLGDNSVKFNSLIDVFETNNPKI